MNNNTTTKNETFQKITKEQMKLILGGSYEAWPAKWRVSSNDDGE